MSNTVAHIAVAFEIAKNFEHFIHNVNAFYLGCIAPDSISSKKNCTRYDKKKVHLREDISDLKWLENECMELFNSRIKEFVYKNIKSKNIDTYQKDFNLGYLVHLLTDKEHHKTIRQIMLRHALREKVKEDDKQFFYMLKNELEALDQYLLDTRSEVRDIFNGILYKSQLFDLPGYVEKELLEKSIIWWKKEYIPLIKLRKLKYLSKEDINIFIENSSQEIIKELNYLIF